MPPGRIAVIGGCGHVGLPLALSFASKGHAVDIVDRNAAAVEAVRQGRVPFFEHGAEPFLKSVLGKTLRVTTEPDVVAEAESIVCVVGTPIDEHLNPKIDDLLRIVDELCRHLRPGQLFVLRSTVYPGATQRIAEAIRRRTADIDVAFCPERVAQGHSLRELAEHPQIVSGVSARATERARVLFSSIAHTVIELAPLEAELAKLFCNSWRYITFAVANQFYTLCAKNGLDYYRIHQAITTEYPRMKGLPTAGFAAGPCLFKDTMQLAAFYNNEFSLGQSAMLVNEGLPRILMEQLRPLVLHDKTAGILGMTFKRDSDDTREALPFKMKKLLLLECARVLCSDEHLKGGWLVPMEQVLEEADFIVIGAPHSAYERLAPRQPTLDPWNLLGRGGLLA